MSDERRQRILNAALAVFMRYGYRRATMDDIAREVGISRPALYLSFSGKEDLLRAVVEVGQDDMLREIQAGLSAHASLEAQLLHVFEVWSVRPFEMVARSPAASELMGGSFDFAKDVFERGAERLAKVIADTIRAAVGKPRAQQSAPEVVARIMIAAAHGFKSAARDAQDLRDLVRDLVRLVVAGVVRPA
jgi:AcrR family transcriptional regulator